MTVNKEGEEVVLRLPYFQYCMLFSMIKLRITQVEKALRDGRFQGCPRAWCEGNLQELRNLEASLIE